MIDYKETWEKWLARLSEDERKVALADRQTQFWLNDGAYGLAQSAAEIALNQWHAAPDRN